MAEENPKTYSLWLEPDGEAYCKLDTPICNISAGCYTQSFEPHITLASGIKGDEKEVSAMAEKLAAELRPVTIKLNGIRHSDEESKAAYLAVEESEELNEALDAAAQLFGKDCRPHHTPQIRLLYGKVEEKIKEEMLKKYVHHRNFAFNAKWLYLWRTDGNPDNWTEIAGYELG